MSTQKRKRTDFALKEIIDAAKKVPNQSKLAREKSKKWSIEVKRTTVEGILSKKDAIEAAIKPSALLPFAQYQNGIRMLSLDGEHLHDISLVSLLVNLANLNSLRVSFCNNLTDITLSALLRCADHRFKELHLKNLSDNLSSAVLTQLFGQMNMSYLHHLTLTDCLPVHDSTVRAISINCLLLEDVRLDWCTSITDDGISALVNGCRQLKKLYLVGLKMLHGSWLPGLELIQPKLSYLDLSQCDLIVDEELLGFVMRKPDVTAFNYYHEEVTNMDKRPNTPAPQPLPPSSVDPPCPASQGAFVDF